MFRIVTAFENEQTLLLKLEGEVKEGEAADLAKAMQSLIHASTKQIILDSCELTYINAKAIEILMQEITEKVFLLNCPTEVINIFHSKGLSERILD